MHRIVAASDSRSATRGESALSTRNLNRPQRAAARARGPPQRRIGAPRSRRRLRGRGRLEDLRRAHAVGNHVDDPRDRHAQTTDAGHPAHLVRTDGDTRERHRNQATGRLRAMPGLSLALDALVAGPAVRPGGAGRAPAALGHARQRPLRSRLDLASSMKLTRPPSSAR
jgi:hypothetical protein